jgi:hypothetical protein
LPGAGEWKKLYLGNGAYLSLPIVSLDVPTQVQTSNDLTACRPKHQFFTRLVEQELLETAPCLSQHSRDYYGICIIAVLFDPDLGHFSMMNSMYMWL